MVSRRVNRSREGEGGGGGRRVSENHFPLPEAAAAASTAAAAFPPSCLHSWIEKEERRKGRKEKLWVRIFFSLGSRADKIESKSANAKFHSKEEILGRWNERA